MAAHQLRSKDVEQLGDEAASAPSEIVISLASIPSRLNSVDLTIRSLLNQSVRTTNILLWLHASLKGAEPKRLLRLVGDRFEIRYSTETSSHRKLIETLRLYRNANEREPLIVTCDDDMMYPQEWLAQLVAGHLAHPAAIIGHRCRLIQYGRDEQVQPYSNWPEASMGSCEPATLAIGCDGVLYPQQSLPNTVLNTELYQRLAPHADDLWFKANALLNGTSVRRLPSLEAQLTGIPIIGSQWMSLKKHNVRDDGNRRQWQALDKHFNLKAKIVGGNNGDRVK